MVIERHEIDQSNGSLSVVVDLLQSNGSLSVNQRLDIG